MHMDSCDPHFLHSRRQKRGGNYYIRRYVWILLRLLYVSHLTRAY